MSLDVASLREEFPILKELVFGKPVVYLDNSATTQKPLQVIDAITSYYTHINSNVHRGVHTLSQRATHEFDLVRKKLAKFVGVNPNEVVFTKGTTEAVNLVASSWGRAFLKPGDRVLVSEMEHHAVILPWQRVCAETGASLEKVPITDAGEIDFEALENLLDERVKLVAICHVSNTLGTINPIAEISEKVHAVGALLFVDGAQGLGHSRTDVKALGADFYTVACHKMYGPTGLGALVCRKEILDSMPPYQVGGGMIKVVTFEKSTFVDGPEKFEPGTPNIADVCGLGAALDWLQTGKEWSEQEAPVDVFHSHEEGLLRKATELLSEIPGVHIHGHASQKAPVLSFTMDSAHPHDIGTLLDQDAVAIRTGHHCCQPLMRRLGVPATARASFAAYNTLEEVETLARAVQRVNEVFA